MQRLKSGEKTKFRLNLSFSSICYLDHEYICLLPVEKHAEKEVRPFHKTA